MIANFSSQELAPIVDNLDVRDRLSCAQVNRSFRNAVSGTPLPNELAETKRRALRRIAQNPDDAVAMSEYVDCQRIYNFGLTRPDERERDSVRSWKLTPQQAQGLRNGYAFHQFPSVIQDALVAYQKPIPKLNLTWKQPRHFYHINFIELGDLVEPVVMAGQDRLGRTIFAFKIETASRFFADIDQPLRYSSPRVATLLQYYQVDKEYWRCGDRTEAGRLFPQSGLNPAADEPVNLTSSERISQEYKRILLQLLSSGKTTRRGGEFDEIDYHFCLAE